MKALRRKLARYRRLAMILLGALALGLAVAAASQGAPAEAFSMEEEPPAPIAQYASGTLAGVFSCDSDRFFLAQKTGVKLLDAKGKLLWEESFSMSKPVAKLSGMVLAVAEENGKQAAVLGESGLMYHAKLSFPLISFSVNKGGCLTAIEQDKDRYMIELFGPTGSRLWYYSFGEENVFPSSADATDNGKMVAISFLDASSRTQGISSLITFMRTEASEARKSTDGIFASVEAADQLVASITFMGDKLLVISDKEAACYIPSASSAKKAWTVPFVNMADRFCAYNGETFAIAFGDPMLNTDGAREESYVSFYNMAGRKLGEQALDGKAQSLSMSWGAAVIGTGGAYWAISETGKVLWKQSAVLDTSSAALAGNSKTLALAQSGGVTVILK
ncbi:MAG: DUF5711 family protein [Clostridiales bacterium]|jgi:hypothetical protein|nr:DUF5711 family protein [Clostridiales bacterium]